MCTPVYIKADAHDQLFLSEAVCRQLNIIQYHLDVEPWRGGRKRNQSCPSAEPPSQATSPTAKAVPAESVRSPDNTDVGVLTVRVRLLQSVKLLPHQGTTVAVQVEGRGHLRVPDTTARV